MAKNAVALKRRIVPGVSLALDLKDDDGTQMQRVFRLTFDYNAMALIGEYTGGDATGQVVWAGMNASKLSIIFWAAVLACHPEYAGEEGLGVIRSYMDRGNQQQIFDALYEAHALALPEKERKLVLEAKEKALRADDPIQPPPAGAEAQKSL